MTRGLVLGGCGVPLPAPPGEKTMQRETLGMDDGSGGMIVTVLECGGRKGRGREGKGGGGKGVWVWSVFSS